MRGAHSRTRLDNNRHDRPGRCRWHSPVFLWRVDKNSKSLRFQRVSDHWALAGSTSAARVLHCRLWTFSLRTFASMDMSFITPQIVLVVLIVREAVFDRDVLTFDIAGLFQYPDGTRERGLGRRRATGC